MINAENMSKYTDESKLYYTDEMAYVLAGEMSCEDADRIEADLEEALCNVRAIAENPLNNDCWRVFWNALQNLTAAAYKDRLTKGEF